MAAPYGGTWPFTSTDTDPVTNIGTANYLNFFKVAYSDTIRLKSQRLESQLANVFERETLRGNPLVLHQVKKVEEGFEDYGDADAATPDSKLNKNSGRAQKLSYGVVPTETREVSPTFWDFAQLFDPRDEMALMRAVAPDSNFQRAVMGAFNRKVDKVIVAAIDADCTVDGSSVSFATDGGTTLGVDSEDPTTTTGATPGTTVDINRVGLSTTKLLNARKELELNDSIMPGERLVCILSPRQHHILLANDAKIQNFDYNASNPLGAGAISEWLGMDFIVTTAVEEIDAANLGASIDTNPFSINAGDTGAGATGEYVYIVTRDSVLVGLDEVSVKMDIIPHFRHSLQVAHYSHIGCVRLDGAKIVRIQCATDGAVS